MRYARIHAGVVAELIDFPDGVALADAIHPDIAAAMVPAGAEIAAGWSWDGETFAPPVPPPVDQAALLAYAADRRWRCETGGIVVGGVPVATDDRSKVMIMGARIKADADASYELRWKGADGAFLLIGAGQIIAISNAVLAHVDACFAVEADVVAGIEAGTVSTFAQIDAADWPVTPEG